MGLPFYAPLVDATRKITQPWKGALEALLGGGGVGASSGGAAPGAGGAGDDLDDSAIGEALAVVASMLPRRAVPDLYVHAQAGHTFLRYTEGGGSTFQISRDRLLLVRNVTGADMAKGRLVSISGSTGQTPTIALADADDDTLSAQGATFEAIANNAFGLMLLTGTLPDVDTSAWAEGTTLYVSGTAGEFTDTAPAEPAFRQKTGVVTNQHASQGTIQLDIDTVRGVPRLHASSHEEGGTDEIILELIATALSAGEVPFVGASDVLSSAGGFRWNDSAKTLELTGPSQPLSAPDSGLAPQLHIGGEAGTGVGTLYVDAYGNLPSLTMRRRDGTQATPAAIGASSIIFNFRVVGYDGSADALGGLMRYLSNGAWSGSNHGMDFAVYLTANGSTASPIERFRVSAGATIVKATVAGAFGHQTGAGGTVAQGSGSGKATGVTLNRATGQITMDGANLAADTAVSFVLTNNQIEANDIVVINHMGVGALGSYNFATVPAAGSATVHVRNVTPGALAEAIVLQFTVIKGVIA